MKRFFRGITLTLIMIITLMCISGCASGDNEDRWEENHVKTGSMQLKYATGFSVDYYDDIYSMITLSDGKKLLIVPEYEEVPADVPSAAVVIKQPLKNIFVVGSASMDFFNNLGALDMVRYSSQEAGDWYIDAVSSLMKDNKIIYAGKYSAPDYELLLADGCDFVIENTMITHSPEVLEKFQTLNISTMVDYSSYESSPYGRMEWIKLYGALTGHYEEAEAAFEAQLAKGGAGYEKTGKTVAYFYITSMGTVNVRKNQDYIPAMIEIAGGEYIFSGNADYDGTASDSVQMEAFYEAVKDCDYFVYNSTIEGQIKQLSELLSKAPLLKNCKAVQEGNVYCTGENLYQSVMELGDVTSDFHKMLAGENDFSFLYKLN